MFELTDKKKHWKQYLLVQEYTTMVKLQNPGDVKSSYTYISIDICSEAMTYWVQEKKSFSFKLFTKG